MLTGILKHFPIKKHLLFDKSMMEYSFGVFTCDICARRGAMGAPLKMPLNEVPTELKI